jgi:hypothetical protein
MTIKTIPKEVKEEILKIIDEFNNDELDLINEFYKYVANFRGNYVYLGTKTGKGISPISRLTYTGDMNDWEFVIYKYSSERYDSYEDFFPGVECLDGTIKGALCASNRAYPPML